MAASSADWVCDWDVYLCRLCDCLYQTVPAGIDVVAHYVGRDQLDTVLLKTIQSARRYDHLGKLVSSVTG